jgi:autotransporter-associated beta strand protein
MLGLDNALPITTVLQVGGATINRYPRGGVLKLNGKNQEVAGLYGAAGYDPGKITSTNAATLTINNATDYDFAGSIGGETPTPVSVTKKGLGVQTFSGTNTYTGNTTVEAGTLVLAPPGELRFVIQNANVANQVTGAGAANLNGLLRLDVSAVTDTKGTWNLVDTTTLAASFGGSFGVAFEGGPAFTDRGGGIYTGNGGWTFTAASGSLTLSSPVLATVIAVR